MALRILTAYRPGGLYTEEHIDRLAKQVKEFSSFDLEPIFGEFPHWWCKMSLFKETGPVLYFDLDTTIVDDLSSLIEIAESERFVTLRDFNYQAKVASGVMSWSGDMTHIYDEFAESPNEIMNSTPGGDQDFLNDGNYCPEFWQDLLPNHVQSYKLHVKRQGVHPDCRVVAYHGRPKPWHVDELVKE